MGRPCWCKLETWFETRGWTWVLSGLHFPSVLIIQNQEWSPEDIVENDWCFLSYATSIHWREVSLSIALALWSSKGYMLMCHKISLWTLEGMDPRHASCMSHCLTGLQNCAEKHPIPDGFVALWGLPYQASMLGLSSMKFSPRISWSRMIINIVYWQHM